MDSHKKLHTGREKWTKRLSCRDAGYVSLRDIFFDDCCYAVVVADGVGSFDSYGNLEY